MSPASRPGAHRRPRGRRRGAWNLLLLVPLVTLVTPWFNADQPRLAGLPFFYWFQFGFVLVGVACVWIVAVMTTPRPAGDAKPGSTS